MNFNLLDENSIILQIGDIKLSNTDDTFGKDGKISGYEYNPLLNPKNSISFHKRIIADIGYGDYRCGVSISDGKDSILLTYGANRINSNAQSMAIGFYDGEQYFFVDESFRDIYGKNPELSRRDILVCKSLWEHNEKKKIILYNEEICTMPTEKEIDYFNQLMDKVERLEPAFEEEKLRELRQNRRRSMYNER